MSGSKLAFHGYSLLLCIIAASSQSVFSQAAARPAPAPTPADIRARVTETPVDSSVPDDPALDKMLKAYSPKVRALDTVIGKLKGDLLKGGIGAGSMGNFVTDALRDRAQVKLGKPVLLAITNSGGLRKSAIAEGNLRAADIFELLPFENVLVSLELTGEQLRRFLNVVAANRDAQSGARIVYRSNNKKENEITSVKLGGRGAETGIDPNATYTIVTIDYLVKRGGEYSILQQANNIQSLNLTMRDAVLDYVKAETAAGREIKAVLDGRWRYDKAAAESEVPQP